MVLVHEGDGPLIMIESNQTNNPEESIAHIASIPQVMEIPLTPPLVR
jgi:hypothetical protein